MRLLAAAIAGLMIALAPARAVVSEAVELDAGPGGNKLSPVWVMKCPDSERLVGLRVHDDGRIAGVRAICARVRMDDGGVRWLGAPALLPEPAAPEPPRVETVTRLIRVQGEGTILHASSAGITRQRGSRALMIRVKRPVDSGADSGPRVERVQFRAASKANDLVCPADTVVVGLRTGFDPGRSATLHAVQLLCGDGLGRMLEPIGAWQQPAAPKKKKGKRKSATPPALKAQRIECGASAINPHDGLAAQAVFGTEGSGRVETIGLSCTGRLDSLRPHSRLYTALRSGTTDALRAVGWATRIDAPTWFDGVPVAVCAPGERGKACIQLSADRYCAEVAGYDRATSFAVGRFAKDAVAPGGQRCERGACRAFASITCAL